MNKLDQILVGVKTVVLLGHIHPDGDCIGSCLALYHYLTEQDEQLTIDVYLENPPIKYAYLEGFNSIRSEVDSATVYDLCICLDCSDRLRMGSYSEILDQAKSSLCIDHHITNVGYAGENIIQPEASSTCEVLYGLFHRDQISKSTAECLYTGLIHDSGVFQYSNTSSATIKMAADLMEKGIDFSAIIADSYYAKTYVQNQILGRALLESVLFLDGRCIFSVIRKKDMEFYAADSNDFDGVVEQLRNTAGVECAIFMYETGGQEYKVSLRSRQYIDVSKIAAYFGGGGHVRAAGCKMSGNVYDVVNNLALQIESQLALQENGYV